MEPYYTLNDLMFVIHLVCYIYCPFYAGCVFIATDGDLFEPKHQACLARLIGGAGYGMSMLTLPVELYMLDMYLIGMPGLYTLVGFSAGVVMARYHAQLWYSIGKPIQVVSAHKRNCGQASLSSLYECDL